MLPFRHIMLIVFGFAAWPVDTVQAQLYYRSAATGNWNAASSWESAPALAGPWNPAAGTPTSADFGITIRSPHTITITASVAIDETTVETGSTLIFAGAISVSINDGAGADLQIDGTLEENSTGAIAWQVGATWLMGATGTLIKTTATSSNNWRNNYWGGISTIPATGRWILRKTSGANPPISSVGGATYPNLIIENNTASLWVTGIGSSFTGSSGFPLIKGNFDIGGSGSNFVDFLNENTNANAVLVNGSVIIRPGNSYRNFGTGTEIEGDLVIDGTLSYDATDARRIIFSGAAPQSVSGSGTAGIFNLVMNKSGNDLTLNRSLKIDNNLTFNNPGGRILASNVNPLLIEDDATVTGASNTGFAHGPVTKYGDEAFSFPVGKNFNLQPIAIGAAPPPAPATFWTEDFGTGCNTGFQAISYNGPNGAWGVTNTGFNESMSNIWYVSAAENGQGAGVCGAGCGSNRTLHLGSSPSIATDPGAAYFESDAFSCGFLGWCSVTNKRAESPAINCTGKTGITLSFNYIEWGEGASDNAILWYYDGSAWLVLADLPKTLCCGGVSCTGFIQGLWNAWSIALPPSANNNPNVRLGFQWVNNGNGVGTDPSFAVDDITLTSSVATPEAFTAEYFYTDPVIPYGNVLDLSLDHISRCEYWTLVQDAGTSSRPVTLSWDANSCGVTFLPDLRVARWQPTGTIWNDLGNGGTTGSTAAGTVVTAAPVSLYGPFTLSSFTATNPLPVVLMYFNAEPKESTVHFEWATASESNSDYFAVERSGNGITFDEVMRVKAAGNSTTTLVYRGADYEPLAGHSWYRLRQTDFDGSQVIHKPVLVRFTDDLPGFVTTDPEAGEIVFHSREALEHRLNVAVADRLGRIVHSQTYVPDGAHFLSIKLPPMARGLYVLCLSGAGASGHFRFLY